MLVFILLQPSCNIKNHIRKDKYLVNKVKVKGEPNGMNDALYNLSKQKPNARLLGVVRYNMWMYLLFENKVDAFFKRDQKIKELSDEIKKERLELATNQNTLTDKQKAKLSKKISKLETKLEDAITNNDEIKAAVDAPVLLDSSLLIESATQMKYYLKDKGYFRDSVKFKVYTHRQKASVVYECFPGPMYYINKYEVAPGDSIIASIIKADTGNYKIKKGKAYSKDLLEDEKTRIFNLLSDRGYYKLKLSNIHYDGDTFIKGDSVSVKMNFEHLEVNSGNRIYKVKNVFIEPEYSLGDTSLKDSLKYKGYIFLSKDPSVKPQVIYDFIYIKPNSLFNDDDKKSTINRLFQLNAYRYIDISYLEDFTATGDTGIINCYIKMTLAKKYLYTGNIELNRTEEADPALTNNYNTLYGISATTGILDRNLAKRALQFQTQLRLAVEVPFDTVHFFRPVPNLLNYQFGLNIPKTSLLPSLATHFQFTEQR